MTELDKLINACKDDIQAARNKRDEANTQHRIQNAIIEALLVELGRLEDALRKSQQPASTK